MRFNNRGLEKRVALLLTVGFMAVGGLSLTACSPAGSSQSAEEADQAFLEDLVSAWVARWDYLADPKQELALDDPKYAEKSKAQLTRAVDIELEKLEPYAELDFADNELGARASDYVSVLEESADALPYLNVDDVKHASMWSDAYDKRTVLILEFVDEYELAIPEVHAETIAEMRTNAELAVSRAEIESGLGTAVCALEWKRVNEDNEYYDRYDYTAMATNSTDTDFANVWLELAVIDEAGVNQGTEYASVTNWRAGQTASFELFYLEKPISALDITARWETADGDFSEQAAICDD